VKAAGRAGSGWPRTVLRASGLGLTLAGFALSAAMTLSATVFEAVATTVRAATGLATVAAAPLVRYRGAATPLREAVGDTTRRLSMRVTRGAARSVGSAAGEALPFVGVGVVAAATAWDLYDACETMQDLGELAAAVDPGRPVDPDSVCGITPPSASALSQGLVHAGTAALDSAWAALGGGPPPAPGQAAP
jgi:hypothetical protein